MSTFALLQLPASRLAFPAELEQAYLKEYWETSIVIARIAAVLCTVLYSGFGILDFWIIPQSRVFAWIVRFGVVCPLFTAIFVVTFLPYLKKKAAVLVPLTASAGALAAGLGIAFIISTIKPGDPGRYCYEPGLILVVIVTYTFIRLPFAWATTVSLLTLATYEALMISFQHALDTPRDLLMFVDVNVFLVSSNIIGMFACYTLEMNARRDYLQRRAIELEGQRLRDAHLKLDRSARLLESSNKVIRRYIPSQLAEKIFRGEHTEVFRPERNKLTIFFSDVEGFTDASDQLDAEDLAAILNEYLSEMSMIAERYGATINQFVGDGIMIFFGAPQATSDRDHALRAVRMALEMQRRMLDLKDVWAQRGIRKPFRARIGINTGHASVGDFGSEGRKVYSAIGVQTNIAARIQAHCEPGKVLISDTTWALVREEIACINKGELELKGVHYPVRAYEVAEAADRGDGPTGPVCATR